MAAAAMRDQVFMRNTVKLTGRIRDEFAGRCRDLGLVVPASHTNFALLRFADLGAAQRADTVLREAGLLMRGMGGYGLSDCLRATICAPDIMDRCIAILKGVAT